MSLQAYQQAAQRAETPRQTEYRLFGQVTRALMEAAKADPLDFRTRVDALDWNRRLWTTLGSDCADPNNALPEQLRASIISLSIWVHNYTSQVIRREEDIEALIDVNRIIMQGLSGQAEDAA
jgi:flagellar biosynthesis activator protein FlaF